MWLQSACTGVLFDHLVYRSSSEFARSKASRNGKTSIRYCVPRTENPAFFANNENCINNCAKALQYGNIVV
jgi:hypothetical protein